MGIIAATSPMRKMELRKDKFMTPSKTSLLSYLILKFITFFDENILNIK